MTDDSRQSWGYGCPEHRGDPSAMSGVSGVCLARPGGGIKASHPGSQICGRALEPLYLGGEERPSREALMGLYEAAIEGYTEWVVRTSNVLKAALARCEREAGEGGKDARTS